MINCHQSYTVYFSELNLSKDRTRLFLLRSLNQPFLGLGVIKPSLNPLLSVLHSVGAGQNTLSWTQEEGGDKQQK